MRTAMLTAIMCAVVSTLLVTYGMAAQGKVRALVVTGGHGFQREPFFAMFDSFADIEWREVQHPQANDMYAPEQRDSYDVIVLYDMVQGITEKQRAQLLETLKRGKPLVVLHHALASYQEWPEYARVIGGRYMLSEQEWDGKTWARSTFRHGVVLKVHIADPKHPITKGLDDFEIHDEVYGGYWVSPEVHELLTVDHPESAKVVGWTKTYGKARVAVLQGGHDRLAYEDENYRTLVQRAILWAARRLSR